MKSLWFRCVGSALFLLSAFSSNLLCASTDTDGDGISDSSEIALGYDPTTVTRVIYVDVNAPDDSGNGMTESSAKKSIKAGIEAAKSSNTENIVLVSAGTYQGENNRGVSFGGFNIKLKSKHGAASTIIDLQNQGIFLSVKNSENKDKSLLDGFTIKNGRGQYSGGAIEIGNSSGLSIRNCIFENNKVFGSGGAIYAYNGTADISNCKFFNNSLTESEEFYYENSGGALYLGFGSYNISQCEFLNNSSYYGGAIGTSESTLNISACIFRNNYAYYGGSIYSFYYDTITLQNSLFQNNTSNYYSFMNCNYDSSINIINCTIFANTSKNGSDLYIDGNFNMYNSIFKGNYTGTPTTIAFSCTTQDSTGLGTGNITSDPLLTSAGYLKAGSPCIDTGNSTNSAPTDLANQQRPYGSAPDMGCYEFIDSDSDGIPDCVEVASGTDPNNSTDALGDADNDGINNLSEFQNGTHPGKSDSDDDGIPDNVEIAQGYNPTLYTKVIYVNPITQDDSGDGQTQETAKKTIAGAIGACSISLDNVIKLLPGLYSGVNNRNLTLDGYSTSIIGTTGAVNTIIDLENTGRFVHLSNSTKQVVIEGITIRNGHSDYGSAIRADNMSPVIRNCRIENNYATQYGAIHFSNTSGQITGTVFFANDSNYGGAISLAGTGNNIIADNQFIFNKARSYGGALYIYNSANATVSSSKFQNNQANREGGAIEFCSNGLLNITNSLFNYNKALENNAVIRANNSSQQCNITNITILNSITPTQQSCFFEGTVSITNSIVQNKVVYNESRPLIANNNCYIADWSSLGSGNITTAPCLNGWGYPLAGSPCIDAGTATNSPEKDIDGVSRPTGNAIDIGCYEYMDTDGDGISDIVENQTGLNFANNADAHSDTDSDGLTNIQEFTIGTSITSIDSDGDGISDANEVAAGYDPLRYTKIIYVDASKLNDSGDGLTESTAKKTIKAAVNLSKTFYENIILVKPGIYTGGDNRGINFAGYDIKLRSTGGAAETIIDLENNGPFLTLNSGETLSSWLDGFTIKNGYTSSNGIAINLNNASLDIRNCIFENNKSGKKVIYDYGDGYVEEYWEDAYATAAIYACRWPVKITNCLFQNNSSQPSMDSMESNAGALNLISVPLAVIDKCNFIGNSGYGSGAICAAGGKVEVSNSRFINNHSFYYGGAVYGNYDYYYYDENENSNNSFILKNCLLLNNSALYNYSDIYISEHNSTLYNLTVTGGMSRDGSSMYFAQNATISNSIITGKVDRYSNATFVAHNNCTSNAWNAYGTNNLSEDPRLTKDGYLKSNSPCINAGADITCIQNDLDGVARISGSIDIGCFEFNDSDSDGIPDNIEIAAGLNPSLDDASGDFDNDGIKNIDEYFLGSKINYADSDGDGINDKNELSLGYDPIKKTRIVYVDASNGNDINDGMSSSTAVRTIKQAIEISKTTCYENIILVAPGVYAGENNRNLDFAGYNIKICSTAGASTTIIDLENQGRFLILSNGENASESWLDGFSIKNGNSDNGSALNLNKASITVKNCIFQKNSASSNGTIYLTNSTGLQINNAHFLDNSASRGASIAGNNAKSIMISNVFFAGNHTSSNGGVLYLDDSDITIQSSRFTNNQGGGSGGVIYMTDSTSQITVINSLFNGNWSKENYSEIHGNNSNQKYTLMNVTMIRGIAPNDIVCHFEGQALITNSIIQGYVTGNDSYPIIAKNNCSLENWNEYGTGNISSDPMLTATGYLRAGSPCIDAGVMNGAPSIDIDGVARPAGNGIDIGCQEFIDSDGDGIPDNVEISSGLNPNFSQDASADKDGDGISNLAEYYDGGQINAVDADGDGISDKDEISQGYNPSRYSQIFYVDGNNGNDTNSGLSLEQAKKTIGAAISAAKHIGHENIVMVASGTYTGQGNKNLNFGGYNIKLRSISGASTTIIDLEGTGPFLTLNNKEDRDSSWLDGFTIRNGYVSSYGIAVYLNNAGLDIKNCIFENNKSGRLVTYDYGDGYVEEYWEDAYSTAAVYIYGRPGRITNTIFRNNTSHETMYGGDGENAGALNLVNANGTVIDNCIFKGNRGYGAGAIVTAGGNVTVSNSRFLNNLSYYNGGAITGTYNYYSYEEELTNTLTIQNCLLYGNKALYNYSDLYIYDTQTILRHVTISGGSSREGGCAYFASNSTIQNSIVNGHVNQASGTLNANYSCNPANWTTNGNGNISLSPMLTNNGYLKKGSPCINSGSPELIIDKDIDGVARGTNIPDMGCQEFIDTDDDGIPDNIEIAKELNPTDASDSTTDKDVDGISNLDEYHYGTSADSLDSDGDGISDAVEISEGYNPQVRTRFIYVSTTGNDANDGLNVNTPVQTIKKAVVISTEDYCENVILVAAGTYSGNENKNIDFKGYDIKLRSISGAPTTIIDLENNGRFLYLSNGETNQSWIDGFTIKNGNADHGSAIRINKSSPIIKNCVFSGNTASGNGTVYAENNSFVKLEKNHFTNNYASNGACFAGNNSKYVELNKNIFIGNKANNYGGALYADDSDITITASRFYHNQSIRYAGAIYLTDSTSKLSVINSLFNGNWSRENYSDIYGNNANQTYLLQNVTIINGISVNDNSAYFEGQANIINSIIQGYVYSHQDRSVIAHHNCVWNDWNNCGVNNIMQDPKLTKAGYLMANSPCIDAGLSNNSPLDDIDGILRPKGNGVDIGCQEFFDSDNDGIPDNVENAAGLNSNLSSDATLDKDGDGINNLAEYYNGSLISTADSDGDGISDKDEVDLGYTPDRFTKVFYVDGTSGNDENSGTSIETAKRTIGAAITAARNIASENIVMVAPGIYTGTGNKQLNFGGFNIKLRSISGAATTIIDLEGSGPFLTLNNKEDRDYSWLDGFTIRNGYVSSYGIAVYLNNAGLDIRNCIFENNNSGKLVTYDYGDGYVEEYWEDAYSTAAVYAQGHPIKISNTVFANNSSKESMYGMEENAGAIILMGTVKSEITNCIFRNNSGCGAGAMLLGGGVINVSNSKFLNNYSHYNGGAISGTYNYNSYSEEDEVGTLIIKNSLFTGNRAKYNYSNLNLYYTKAELYHITTSRSNSREGSAFYFERDTTIKNSILSGQISKANIVLAASYNCSEFDLSSYGSNNLTQKPQLTQSGMLTASSPCINSGERITAIDTDIDGNLRNSGNVDIGCYEFVDSDADGIPDSIETQAGLNPNNPADGNSDIDNDGVANLSEYIAGTKIDAQDTDADGINDNNEILQGYDPCRQTRFIYVSQIGNDENDGLSQETAVHSLKKAILLAQNNIFENVILVAAGTYSGNNNRNLDFGGYNIKLRSMSGATSTIIDLENNGRFVNLSSGEDNNSSLDGFTIRNGYSDYGSVLRLNKSKLLVRNCVFEHNAATQRGVIYFENTTDVRIENNIFRKNSASYGGVLAASNSYATISQSNIFENNIATSYAGAVYQYNSEISFKGCRFLNNQAKSNGGAIYLDGSSSRLNIENTLFNSNWSLHDNSDIVLSNANQVANIVNSTICNGISRNDISCYFEGQANIANSILIGKARWNEDRPLQVNYSYSSSDWGNLGSGNITGDAKLSNAGFLLKGSPCINAGNNTLAPATDINGVNRPVGSAVDIGCQEFGDSDQDGIPDDFEIKAGMNHLDQNDAILDKDGDGVPNLKEYEMGTDIASNDSDLDGIDDGAEISSGYNPLVVTQIIYVDNNATDDTGSGLTQENAKKTISGAIASSKTGGENIILVLPGRYTGNLNRNLNFGGYNIKIRSISGAKNTIIDLSDANQFIYLDQHENKKLSWLDGFTLTNGNGQNAVISIYNAGLSIRNCVITNHRSQKDDDYYYYNRPGVIYLDNADVEFIKSEITDNNYELGNNLIYAHRSKISMNKVQISGNDSGSSELIYLYRSALDMINSLVVRNNTASTGCVFRISDDNSLLNAINCTMAYNTNGVSEAFSNSGNVSLQNCILLEKISGGTRNINYCCTSEDYSEFGNNNIQTDPMLTKGGFLTADSPCIDAGSSNGAPTEDIVGNPRPFGNGVDIGSEEFADVDNDGISDFYEAMCGGNLEATGDADNDGLSNLQEYQMGSNALKIDSDNDGMPDGWEVSNNLDLLRNDARGDKDGDSLLNIEEYENSTNPNNVDTDGDGKNDYWEVKEAFSNPNVVDFNGSETLVMTVNGNTFSNSNGGWEAENTYAFIRDRSGWIEYTFATTTAGVYQLELEVQQRIENASTNVFNVSCYVDGGFSSTQKIELNENGIGKARYFMPQLQPGSHVVKFVWSNVYRNTTLQINNFKLFSLGGPDSDNDGIPDWVESRLENMSEVSLPASSKTSPLCVEGGNASFIEQISVTGFYTPEGEIPETPTILNAAFNKWYSNIPLNPDGDNNITVNVSYQNDAKTVSQKVTWEATDIIAQGSITIRKNDSLRLTASLPADYVGNCTITVENKNIELSKGEAVVYKFENAGDIPVTVSWTPEIGAPETHTMIVKVRSAEFNGNPICYVNTKREWSNPGIGSDIVIEADRNIEVTDYGIRNSARLFALEGNALGSGYITARLYEGGPIMATSTMRVIDATTHVNDGYHQILVDFGDGTALYDGYVVVDQVEEGMQIFISLWGSNTLFEDGTREKWFDASQFDSNGELHYSVLGGSNFTTCQSIYLYQNGVLVKQLQ